MVVSAVILSLYSYPALRTAFTTSSLRLPAVSAPDLGLYLSLSKNEKDQNGATLNPYYRIPVPYAVGYLKFRLGPALFAVMNNLFGGRIWLALFAWNILWWLFLCLATIWLFDRWLPRPAAELVLAGVSLLTLVSFDGFVRVITDWIHLSPAWISGGLPYIRPFAPQMVVPLLLCYCSLQIRALNGKNIAVWGFMALLQFVAFTAFPYGTLMMAGTTAAASLWYIFNRPRESAWILVLGFLLVCAAADIGFAVHGASGFHYSFPGETSLIRFQPSLVAKSIGKLWLVTAILVAATAFSRKLRPELKWPLVGLGLSNMFFVLGDAVIPERIFYLSDHIGHFYQPTIAILLIFLVSAYLPGGPRPLQRTRTVSLAIVGLCFIYGFLMAEGNYRTNLGYNVVQADLASWFGRGEVSAHDLVITQFSGTQYDACEWIPLLSEAEVLYCRNAQLALTPEQNRDVQRLREVLYLYFGGKDHQWVETAAGFERYGLYGELSSFRGPGERDARIIALRQEMLPLFERIENEDPSIHSFFRRFRRVWIIREKQNPFFVDTRLATYLNLEGQQASGSLQITSSEPK